VPKILKKPVTPEYFAIENYYGIDWVLFGNTKYST
jgi:hypothetical protein